MRKFAVAALLAAGVASFPLTQAQAHDHHGGGDGLALGILGAAVVGTVAAAALASPPPAYEAPPPVVYAPAPVVVQPAPVYVAPPPVVYAPAPPPVVYYGYGAPYGYYRR